MDALSLKLPDGLSKQLSSAVAERGTSQSELVREAITEYLAANASAPKGSAAAAAKHWAGIVRGPADLSTDARHMVDFGR